MTATGGGSSGARRRRALAAMVAILALATAVRVVGLTERAIWLDETVSLEVAAQPAAAIARGAAFDNHTPPLYYLVLHAWFRLVPPTVVTLRLPSVAADLACLAVLMVAVARAFGRRAGVWVGAAYAVAPFAVRLAQEGRMYSLLAALLVGCFAAAAGADRRRHDVWPYVAVAALAAAALYTHYYAILSLVVLHGVMAWRLRADRDARRRWWLAAAGATIAFLPWLPVVTQVAATGGQTFRAFRLAVLPYAALRFAVGFSVFPTNVADKLDLRGALLGSLPTMLVIAGASTAVVLLGVRELAAGRWPEDPGDAALGRGAAAAWLVLALAAIPPLLALAVTTVLPSLDARYLVISFPFVLVLAALGVIGRDRGVWLPVKAIAVAVFLVGAVAQVADPDAGTTPWGRLVTELERRAPEGGQVLVRPGFYDRVLDLHLDRGAWRVVDNLEEARAGNPTWLVEVAFLTRNDRFSDARWTADEVALLPDGNGLRLSRLAPRPSARTDPDAPR